MRTAETELRYNKYFTLIERKTKANATNRAKVEYIIFRKGATALEEVWRGRGGGHTTLAKANDEFDRLFAVEAFKNMPRATFEGHDDEGFAIYSNVILDA